MSDSLDILVPIKEDDLKKCQICLKEFKNGKMALPAHVAVHKVEFSDYLTKFYLNGVRPKCPVCSQNTRYNRGKYSFKKYCISHSNIARSEWSKKNGYGSKVNASWRKGLTKETNTALKKHSERMSGSNNPFYGKNHSEEIYKNISEKRSIKTRISFQEFENKKSSNNVICLSGYCDYINSVNRNLKYLCNICNTNYSASFLWHECPNCNNSSSKPEEEICAYLDTLGLNYIRNTREIIKPQELDIYLLNNKFAIEYNGLFWHTHDRRNNIKYHLNKTISCKQKGINLIHIFSDEWLNKKDIVLSVLNHKLGLNSKKINTRKMILLETSTNNILQNFFDTTHISGHTLFTKAFYLQDPSTGEIVAALSLRRPFIKKYGLNTLEIARFATKLNASVPGGFSRLFKLAKQWAKNNGYNKIITYADLRFGAGSVYILNGFTLIGQTVVDYWYTDGKKRYNRFQYRAKNGKSEKNIAESAGVKKVYGCGSNIYSLDLF